MGKCGERRGKSERGQNHGIEAEELVLSNKKAVHTAAQRAHMLWETQRVVLWKSTPLLQKRLVTSATIQSARLTQSLRLTATLACSWPRKSTVCTMLPDKRAKEKKAEEEAEEEEAFVLTVDRKSQRCLLHMHEGRHCWSASNARSTNEG